MLSLKVGRSNVVASLAQQFLPRLKEERTLEDQALLYQNKLYSRFSEEKLPLLDSAESSVRQPMTPVGPDFDP